MNFHCECIQKYCEKYKKHHQITQKLLDDYALASKCEHNDEFRKQTIGLRYKEFRKDIEHAVMQLIK